MKDSHVIKILKYGEQVGLDGTTWPMFRKWAIDHGGIGSEKELANETFKNLALKRIFTQCFEKIEMGEQSPLRYVLKPEYSFRLVEYCEFQETKKLADHANGNAQKAFITATLAIVVSAIMGMVYVFNPLSVNPDDLKILIKSNKGKDVQKVEISKLQMAQILSAMESIKLKPISKPVMKNPSNEDSMLDAINRYYEQQ